jgi:rhodanese-related sulfurtransferase
MLTRVVPVVIFLLFSMPEVSQGQVPDIQTAVLNETGTKTTQVSTDDLRKVLADKTAMVFDARPASEFATSHIPGAINVAQKPGTSKALYVSDVAEIGRSVGGDKSKAIIVYCNGPFCGKSKRLSDELLAAGFTHVRRYQLGIPVWRALGGVTQIETEGARYVMHNDHTAVWLDTRSTGKAQPTLVGAKRISVEVAKGGKDNAAMQRAKNDGTLPINDHNTRIIVFGDNQQDVEAVADSIAKEAFHNVAFFAGTTSELVAASK